LKTIKNLNKYFLLLNSYLPNIFKLPQDTCIIILNGGIGNQLFQFYLGEELRNQYSKNVVYFDMRSSYKTNHDSYLENFFDIDITKYNPSKNNFLVKNFFLLPLILRIAKFIYLRFRIKLVPNLYFDNLNNKSDLSLFKLKTNISIFYGTWHKYINKYIYASKNIILKFRDAKGSLDSSKYKYDFIAVHVRRGDYIYSRKTSEFHGNLENSYFINSVKFLRKRFGFLPVLLFSDDYNFLNENLKLMIPYSIVVSSNSTSSEKDFMLMSKGKYFVLSNSTFSWFAAFLSTKKNKFIIVPKYWFNKIKTTKDYIYRDWNYKII